MKIKGKINIDYVVIKEEKKNEKETKPNKDN